MLLKNRSECKISNTKRSNAIGAASGAERARCLVILYITTDSSTNHASTVLVRINPDAKWHSGHAYDELRRTRPEPRRTNGKAG